VSEEYIISIFSVEEWSKQTEASKKGKLNTKKMPILRMETAGL
jgi:hypothetical protein